jgi:hypothetical protein
MFLDVDCESCKNAATHFYMIDYSNGGIEFQTWFCRCSAHSVPSHELFRMSAKKVTLNDCIVFDIMLS